MDAGIYVESLFKRYPKGPEVLHGVDLQIPKGAFFTLLGPNGAGKTTLIQILTALMDADSGTFSVAGFDPRLHFQEVQRRMGVASQSNEVDLSETPAHLLTFQGRLFGMLAADAVARAVELLTAFHLDGEKDKKAGTLSGGNLRRLHCALALVHRPEILFLDEPTVGMDPMARDTFWNVITRLNREEGVTVFLTTQYLEEADKHASEMALMLAGKIVYAGAIAGFKKWVNPADDLSLDESYLEYVKREMVV